MTFVGREKETARILAAVSAGRHVVVTGKFGMGKSALSRHVAGLAASTRPFLFASASLSPAQICAALVSQLPTRRCARAKSKAPKASYLALRARLVSAARKSAAPVVVLDDISRVTAPKADLVRHLAIGGLLLIVILDTGLPERDRKRLLAWLEPSEKVHLAPLRLADSMDLLDRLSKLNQLGWDRDQIAAWARASSGYPLRLLEIATRARPLGSP
jgi:energy-coupling factor transporter ATP-binding protein EcfA2